MQPNQITYAADVVHATSLRLFLLLVTLVHTLTESFDKTSLKA